MGTHPIFESDFDCLTEPISMLLRCRACLLDHARDFRKPRSFGPPKVKTQESFFRKENAKLQTVAKRIQTSSPRWSTHIKQPEPQVDDITTFHDVDFILMDFEAIEDFICEFPAIHVRNGKVQNVFHSYCSQIGWKKCVLFCVKI